MSLQCPSHFSRAEHATEPNQVCPESLGFPGTLPVKGSDLPKEVDKAQSSLCGVAVRAGVEMTLSFAGTAPDLLSWKQMGPKVPLLAIQQLQKWVTILDISCKYIYTIISNKVRK